MSTAKEDGLAPPAAATNHGVQIASSEPDSIIVDDGRAMDAPPSPLPLDNFQDVVCSVKSETNVVSDSPASRGKLYEAVRVDLAPTSMARKQPVKSALLAFFFLRTISNCTLESPTHPRKQKTLTVRAREPKSGPKEPSREGCRTSSIRTDFSKEIDAIRQVSNCPFRPPPRASPHAPLDKSAIQLWISSCSASQREQPRT